MSTTEQEPGTAYIDCTGKAAPELGAVISMRYGDAFKITRVDELNPPRIDAEGAVSTHMITILPTSNEHNNDEAD